MPIFAKIKLMFLADSYLSMVFNIFMHSDWETIFFCTIISINLDYVDLIIDSAYGFTAAGKELMIISMNSGTLY